MSNQFDDACDAVERGDYETGFKLMLAVAERGFATAQFFLGDMYIKGQGVPQDGAQAMKWLRLAAEQGDSVMQWSVGQFCAYGSGVPQNLIEGYMWLSLAADSDEDLRKDLDEVAEKMTAAQIAEAQSLVNKRKSTT